MPCVGVLTAISSPFCRGLSCSYSHRLNSPLPTLRRSGYADVHPAHDAHRPGRADAALEPRPAARGEPRRRGARRQGAAPVGDARPVRLRERRRGAERRDDRPRLGRARRPRQREAPDDGRPRDRRLPELAQLATALSSDPSRSCAGRPEAHGVPFVPVPWPPAAVVVVVVVVVVDVPAPAPHPFWNPITGWSSAPFGATPSWPWMRSKKKTPVTVTQPVGVWKCFVAGGKAVSNACRAWSICASSTAPTSQPLLGNSAIIVANGGVVSAIARWMSLSSSSL